MEGGDGVDVQIHAQSVAELIGDQLRIDTGLTRKTGMRASHDLKRRPFELDGFQPRRQEPPPSIVAPEGCGELAEGNTHASGSGALLSILNAGDASTLNVVAGIRQMLPRVATTLPSQLKIQPLADQAIFVRGAVSGVVREAIIAACLTGIMILIFLGSWRSTVIIAVSIPLSILASVITLGLLTHSRNPFKLFQRAFESGFERLRSSYRLLLTILVERRGIFVPAFLIVCLSASLLVPWLGQDFFPSSDNGEFILHVRAKTGTRIEETARLCDLVENSIRRTVPPEEMDTITDNIGLAYSQINMIYNTSGTIGAADADILVSLKPEHRPTATYVRQHILSARAGHAHSHSTLRRRFFACWPLNFTSFI